MTSHRVAGRARSTPRSALRAINIPRVCLAHEDTASRCRWPRRRSSAVLGNGRSWSARQPRQRQQPCSPMKQLDCPVRYGKRRGAAPARRSGAGNPPRSVLAAPVTSNRTTGSRTRRESVRRLSRGFISVSCLFSRL